MLLAAIKLLGLLVFGFTSFIVGATLERFRLSACFNIDIDKINERRRLQSKSLL